MGEDRGVLEDEADAAPPIARRPCRVAEQDRRWSAPPCRQSCSSSSTRRSPKARQLHELAIRYVEIKVFSAVKSPDVLVRLPAGSLIRHRLACAALHGEHRNDGEHDRMASAIAAT
jgi:hypothetical protein